jgi:AbrB family looped-hinge helix DNA binding protein
MRTTIDSAGRLVVPKRIREELGFTPGTELELDAVDGRLEVIVPSRVRVEDGPRGIRFADAAGAGAAADRKLSARDVRELMERGRR